MAQPSRSRDHIGYRVANWRAIAGLSQRELAERIGVTREYISMIESGRRPVNTRRLLNDLANALSLRVEDLTLQPIEPRNAEEMVLYALAPAIRRALDGEDDLDLPARAPDLLAAEVDRALSLRMAAGWDELAVLLPGLLVETARHDDEAGHLLHVRMLFTAALMCLKAGHLDLARRCADRATVVAEEAGDPAHQGAAAYVLGQAALAGGSPRLSLRAAERGAELVQAATPGDDEAFGMAGMLHLHSALSAGSLGQHDRAADHLTEAADLAAHVVGDPWRLQFGPANVGVWRVGVACESADWGRAPELAAAVDVTQLRTPDRVSRLHVDAARGWYEVGNPSRATIELLAAMQISPRATRVLPCVREVTSQLARDAGRRGGSTELKRLVAWVGVDPFSE